MGQVGYGQIGDLHAPNEEAYPVILDSEWAGATMIAAGLYHGCALLENDKGIRCWGNGTAG